MTTTETTGYAVDGRRAAAVARARCPPRGATSCASVDPEQAQDAASMVAAAGLGWTVEQHPLEAVVQREYQSVRVPVPRHVANVRSDTRTVLGVVGEGYEPLQNAAAFAFCDAITDSGRAHWIGAGSTRGGARVHALMRLDREIRIGGAEGEDVLPLLCFRNGHDGGLAVTVSVAPFRLACLNGMLLPIEDAQRTWKARHTAHVEARLADARRTLGIAWRYYDELEELGGRLIREPIGEGEFERFLARLVPLPDPVPDRGRPRRAQRRAGARGDPHRLPRGPRPRRRPRHTVGRAAGGHGLRRSRPADAADGHPHRGRGPVRTGDGGAAAQGPSTRTARRGR